MALYSYVTNRTIPNKKGEETGKVRAFVKTGSDTAEVDYTCAECGKAEHITQPFKRPFSLKCRASGGVMKRPKLKGKNT